MPLSYVVEIIEGAYTRLGPNGGLIALNPHIPVEFRTEWFLTPKQHALETLAFSLLYGSIAYYCHCRAINSDAWKALRPVRVPTTVDAMCFVLAGTSYAAAYYYKHIAPGSWRVAYMLQPCHVLTATIAILSVLPGRWANYIFQVMVTLTWSSVVAMAFPDLSDYTHKGDMFNYWYEHALILVLPIALSVRSIWCLSSYRHISCACCSDADGSPILGTGTSSCWAMPRPGCIIACAFKSQRWPPT
ncbi:hypothetical protein, variant 3 [Aphanomyces invadans]|uniref:Uncharacterized protein n=1 Tax=Aphanomyces invadans TaxID=157072 RepID=A0A024UCN1_9STRA|nr:hypothetical protein, variant 2 [Aphanomyces invadans]XP_008867138.1 hypothetical protein, variant 3 [Aphanomyces invadans]ETW04181.1 hypothetical protein, variant 2 [Aphanomyces invadans]ETW04182.1 hypothetical protein, variant 3 [Aphanomyces invadans]|eukprot:XP_008867137.1 hypothetical protein, variant 2 [Aphanomyces invadans]